MLCGTMLTAERRLQDEARKQNQARVAIGFEHGEAIVGIAGVEPCDLPSQMGGESEEPEREYQSAAGSEAGAGARPE